MGSNDSASHNIAHRNEEKEENTADLSERKLEEKSGRGEAAVTSLITGYRAVKMPYLSRSPGKGESQTRMAAKKEKKRETEKENVRACGITKKQKRSYRRVRLRRRISAGTGEKNNDMFHPCMHTLRTLRRLLFVDVA